MTGNEQLPLDIEIEQTPWGKWVDPQRRAAQVRNFMEYAHLQQIPDQPWSVDAPEVERLDELFADWLPSMDVATSPDNHDLIDALVCFLGECFLKFAGARWVDCEWFGQESSFYDEVNPSVVCDTPDEDEIVMWSLVEDMINYHPEGYNGMFSYFAAALRDYAEEHQDKRREDARVE